MTLSYFFCILLLTLFFRKFGIAKNHALFSLKLGWCNENDILQVCVKCVVTIPKQNLKA